MDTVTLTFTFTNEEWKNATNLFKTLDKQYLKNLDEKGQSIVRDLKALFFDSSQLFATDTNNNDHTSVIPNSNDSSKINNNKDNPVEDISLNEFENIIDEIDEGMF